MSDHDVPARELIDIVAQPGAAETILALHAKAGTATVAELGRPGAADVVKIVPALAAAGLVTGRGSLDGVGPESQLTLTADGEGAAVALLELENWVRRHRRRSPRRPAWSRHLRAVWLHLHTVRYRDR
ncbi:MAG: hypothetical protein QOH97_1244 [Actinoplanes sp.]|jgi:hypothetical protein|nr:hypothetical protein [Actinoplanes sp.]